MTAQHSVNTAGFYIMARRCGEAIDRNEGQASALQLAKDILAHHD